MTDLETRLTAVLREHAEQIRDFDAANWVQRTAIPAAHPRVRRYAVPFAALAAAASVVLALSLGHTDAGRQAAPPATSPTGSGASYPALTGTWQLTTLDGAPVHGTPQEAGTLAFGESGWFAADAGCVTVGGWYTWAADTGLLQVLDWSPPGDLPPAGQDGCYRPAVLAVLRPGTVLTRKGNRLIATDGTGGAEFAQLRLIPGQALLAFPPGPARTYAVRQVSERANVIPLSHTLIAPQASWARLSVHVQGGRAVLDLRRPQANGVICDLARLEAPITPFGRLGTISMTEPADGGECAPIADETRLVQALSESRAIAEDGTAVQLLGDNGRIELALGPPPEAVGAPDDAPSPPAGASLDRAPLLAGAVVQDQLLGYWRLDYLRTDPANTFAGNAPTLVIKPNEFGGFDYRYGTECPDSGAFVLGADGKRGLAATDRTPPEPCSKDPAAQRSTIFDTAAVLGIAPDPDGRLVLLSAAGTVIAAFRRA